MVITKANKVGILYIVATPIGNIADISQRAIDTLAAVDCILAEDTRHSGQLLSKLNIDNKLLSYHQHNEQQRCQQVITALLDGQSMALISDAGTPLISDPGFPLVRAAHQAGIQVSPLPGACAAIAALSVSGMASDAFYFAGFLPAKTIARQQRLAALQPLSATLIFYESPHRLVPSLSDMITVFGGNHQAVMAREISKHYETILSGHLQQLLECIQSDSDQQRGEIVLLLAGAKKEQADVTADDQKILEILLAELPLKQAVALTAKISGKNKNALYEMALAQQKTNQ